MTVYSLTHTYFFNPYFTLLFSGLEATCRVRHLIKLACYIHTYIHQQTSLLWSCVHQLLSTTLPHKKPLSSWLHHGLYSKGESVQPWRTPLPIIQDSDKLSPILMIYCINSFFMEKKKWLTSKLNNDLKKRIVKSTVPSGVLHCMLETWDTDGNLDEKVRSFWKLGIRRMLKISWTGKNYKWISSEKNWWSKIHLKNNTAKET